jgi:tetratricopeptide (TPR) repeat protein
MNLVQIDPLSWIPDSLKREIVDEIVTFVADQAKKTLGDEVSGALKRLRSDAAFQDAVDRGLKTATDRFVREYMAEDEDLVAAIARAPDFWKAESVRQTLLEIIRQPGVYLGKERMTLARSFADVLRQRINRERVDRAVTFFLRCLAEELWTLPELQPIYALQFQRMTAEATRQQVELQKAQLQAATGLGADIRDALLELTDTLAEQKLLPEPEASALPERPQVYHNLPQPDYGKFIGRQEELAQVHRILRPYPHSRHPLVTIDGIGGIGKSALALEAAHRYLRDYDRLPEEERFDAIIWTSAKSEVLTADGIAPRRQITRTLDDIYTAIAIALEREDITRARPEEQDELVTKALTQQRTLLIVDNLETVDDERVNAFLREIPAPTKAIVTTRHRIDVAYPIRLTGMPKEDGLDLIAQECEKKDVTLTDAEAEKLYRRTGGVPLAMVWSVAQMGYGYGVDSVLRRLGEPTGDIARFCFEGAMERIRGKPAHKLLMALSLFATDASREALGCVAGLGEDILSRDEGLVTLERLSLVNKQGNRYRMLPLTKHFASNELTSFHDSSDLENRWIEYYSNLCDKYGDEYWNWTNYDWLLAEGDNILSLAEWAIANEQSGIVLHLAYAILRYLDITGRWAELVRYGEMLYGIAQYLGKRRVMAWVCTHWLSWIYGEQGSENLCRVRAEEGIRLYRKAGDNEGVCFSMAYLSRALRKSGHIVKSRKKTEEMLEFAREIDYKDGIAVAHDQLGKAARDLGEWEEAEIHFESAQDWCEREESNLDVTMLMNIRGNLGWTVFNQGDCERGKELCEESLDFFDRIGGKGYSTVLRCQLAAIELALGNTQKAYEYATTAAHWAKSLKLIRETQRAEALLERLERN